MNTKKSLKSRLFYAIISLFFVFTNFLGIANFSPAYAIENNTETTTEAEESNTTETENTEEELTDPKTPKTCTSQVPKIGWLVCSISEAASDASDALFEWLNKYVEVDPLSSESDSPIYKIWQYCRDITNILFIIFLLIVVVSQVTGIGISNYGIKKALPKLIVAAVMVNVSFLICELGIEISNIFGAGIKDIFESVKVATMGEGATITIPFGELFATVAGGVAGTIAGIAIVVETGTIWMLIPTILGALTSLVIAFFTMILRKALIILLVMVAPLAIVSNIFPNTEKYFRKWRDMLIKMLVFYPMFSLLFGAADIAGWAIMSGANGDAIMLLVGILVKFIPLVFSWQLLKMSGTIVGDIAQRVRTIAGKPLATNRAWADSHRQLTAQKYLASKNSYTPSLYLNKFLTDRKISREAKTKEYATTVQNRGLAYTAGTNYRKDGSISREGERSYEMQARNAQYATAIKRHTNNFEEGLADLKNVNGRKSYHSIAQLERLKNLDAINVEAADLQKYELARGSKIEYENARGFEERVSKAMDAYVDDEAKRTLSPEKLREYKMHATTDADLSRFKTMLNTMEGKAKDVGFIAADAAHGFGAQSKIVRGKFKEYFDLTAPTQDVVHRLDVLTKGKDSNDYIDEIIAGMGVLNMRGDTDLVREALNKTLEDHKVDLGTYASQSLANFLMFDVKDNDPFLRRFGKYINLETAKMFNDNDPAKRRHNPKISMEEYVTGEYDEYDENGNQVFENGAPKKARSKRSAKILLEGTSFKGMERTAMKNMTDAIRDASYDVDENGNKVFNIEKFKASQNDIWNAIMPNIISDQFNFLSGSEQIKSLAKNITGTSDHNFDWEGIFGKELAATLTPEQKADYIKFLNKRTKDFLGGHVPNQIGRTKSDMLMSIMDLYTLTAASEKDPSILDKVSQIKGTVSADDYKVYEELYGDDADNKLINSFKEESFKGFLKMYRKGYQGDTKANLSQHVHAEEQYQKFFGKEDAEKDKQRRRNNRRKQYDEDEDEDEGIPTGQGYNAGQTDYYADMIKGEIDNLSKKTYGSTREYCEAVINKFNEYGLEDAANALGEYYNTIKNSEPNEAVLYDYIMRLLGE